MIWHYSTCILDTSTFFQRGQVDQPQLNAVLRSYGELGWELVTITPMESNDLGTSSILLTFKQPSKTAPTTSGG